MPTLTTFSPVLLFNEDAKAVHEALLASGHHALASMIASKAHRSESDCKFIDAVQKIDDNEFDVDDEPVVSASEHGAYVMIWKWVSNEDAGVAGEK